MRPLYVCHAPFTEWVLAASVYRIGDQNFLVTGSPLCRGWPLKGLSPVMGNYHAGFLGGLGAAMPPGYPVFLIFKATTTCGIHHSYEIE